MSKQSKIRLPKLSKNAITLMFWAFSLICAVTAGYFLAVKTEPTLYVLGFAAAVWFLYAFPRPALYILVFLPVIGELIRIPAAIDNGILISDVFIPLLLVIWAGKKIIQKKAFPKSVLLAPFLIFCVIAALSLLQAFLFIKPVEVLVSSFYLVRLASYTLLYLVVVDSIEDERQAKKILACVFSSAFIIAVAGFIQLIIYPDLGKLEALGWDPHINRLVSTWLDPNFIGGYLAFIICVLIGIIFYTKKIKSKIGLIALTGILGAALFLTYSRSAYLAVAAGIIIIGLLKSRTLIITALIIFLLGIGILPRASQRLTDLTYTISSVVFNTAENPDATARLRIKNWEQTWGMIYRRPLLGSGYNTLRYVKYNEGFVEDPLVHSASGSDSSLLTIFATTGIIGLLPFIWFYFKIFRLSILGWKTPKDSDKKSPSIFNGFSLGMFAGLSSLAVHSLFTNSLLFPQILIPVIILVGILEWHVKMQRLKV